MSALRLYPLSCVLNRAARWTLDSWLARSLQLLPSGQCRPKRQLQYISKKYHNGLKKKKNHVRNAPAGLNANNRR